MVQLRSFRAPPVPTSRFHELQEQMKFGKEEKDRNPEKEPPLNMAGIQGDLLLGHEKSEEAIVFFKLIDHALFKDFLLALPLTSAADVFRPDPEDKKRVAFLTGKAVPDIRFSVAFTLSGLQALGRDPGSTGLLGALAQKLSGRAVAELNDPDPATWMVGKPTDDFDGVIIVTVSEGSDLDAVLASKFDKASAGKFGHIQVFEPLRGKSRPGGAVGHEHFGFLDGVSQPGIRGCVDAAQTILLTQTSSDDPDQGLPGQDLLWPGEFVLGYETQVAGDDFAEKGPPLDLPQPWMKDGAFLVLRRLQQFVPEFHAGITQAATQQGMSNDLLAAQIVGRWPNGAPVLKSSTDDPDLGTDPQKNNDFEFGDDRKGLTCPWAAHIRKAYPRNDVPGDIDPGDDEGPAVKKAEAFTQTHRMLRRGIPFGREVQPEEEAQGKTLHERGLLFKCYVADIEEQFEFVQKAWSNAPDFAHPSSGHDVVIGQASSEGDRAFAGVGEPGKKPTFSFRPWVRMTGGAYFFVPSIDFVKGLGAATV